MKLALARLTPFALPLVAPLATAHGPIARRHGVLLALETSEGAVGFGEATPAFGGDTAWCRAQRDLERLVMGAAKPGEVDPAAAFAFETACSDLAAQAQGLSLAAWLAGETRPRASVRVNALLACDEPAALATEACAAHASGFTTLKLKVGAGALALDRARLAAVRAAVGAAVALRIDANGAWTPDGALRALRELAAFELELVEQPVAADDLAGLARVRIASLVPVAADESLADPTAADRVLEGRAADLLVLKPGVLGGLAVSLLLARRAARRGVRAYATSGLDGAIARAAALALAASLPDPLPACGLATGALLAADLAMGPVPKDGVLELPLGPGLGVVPDPHALAALALGPTRELRP